MPRSESRKAKIEPIHIEEAAKLKRLFQTHNEPKRSQAAFAEEFDLGTQGNVWQYLNAKIPLNAQAAAKFAKGLGIHIRDFSPRLAGEIEGLNPASTQIDLDESPDTVRVRKVIFKISAGIAGFAVDYLDNGEGTPLYFPKAWADKKNLVPERLYATRVSGSSMFPTILPSDVIIVNTGDTKRAKDAVCAINHEGEFTVKRLKYEMRRWWLISDNPNQKEYPPTPCSDGTYILGRVVHLHRDF